MPRSRLFHPAPPAPSHRIDRYDRGTSSSPLTPPANVQVRKRESQQPLPQPQPPILPAATTIRQKGCTVKVQPNGQRLRSSDHQKMAATRTQSSHFSSPPLSRRPRGNKRRKEDVRPERKASVKKEHYDLDDDEGQDEDIEAHQLPNKQGDTQNHMALLDDDDSDLSDAPPPPEDGLSAIDRSDCSDDDMAAKLQEAGDGESLLGSGESDGGPDDDEERYIIADAAKAESKANARLSRLRLLEEKRAALRRRHLAKSSTGARHFDDDGQDGDIEDAQIASGDEEFGSLSPETMRLLGLPVLEDELFHEQEGFHSDSEPSFSDFFGSDGEGARMDDDDDEMTSFHTSDEDDDISDLDEALAGEPFIAHVGAVNAAHTTEASDLAAAIQAGADIARQDIPLLVIEDLDGRLIYARAGDGEAVFGSDGEFEFVDDSDEDDTSEDEERSGRVLHARDPRWNTPGWQGQDDAQLFPDDGDTTDELPDEDMPFPRLLVGSVDPRGGRTSRRARAMAAQMRRLSPNPKGLNHSGHKDSQGHTTVDSAAADDGANSVESLTTPATEVDTPFPHVEEEPKDKQGSAPSLPSFPATPSTKHRPLAAQVSNSSDAQGAGPAMGSFIPSSSKSVHRAVIDGSSQAASPFTSKYSLQRKGLAGKRRPRRSSFSTHHDTKRLRRSSLPANGACSYSEAALSSPETIKAAPLPMDLDDVVDASMLWRGGDSSDTGTGDVEDDSNASDETEMPAAGSTRRTRSKTAQSSDGFGLNSNAFSRWRKIPMGAFRDQQQTLSRGRGPSPVSTTTAGSSAGPSRGRGRTTTHHTLGNFLLQRVSSSTDRRFDHSPFRRTGSGGSSLHMVVPSLPAASQEMGGNGQHHSQSFIVSPVLWPVRGSRRGSTEDSDSALPATLRRPEDREGGFDLRGTSPFAQSSTLSDTGSRKMTKREKRERKAQRAAARSAARAEKHRLREESVAGTVEGEEDGSAEAGASATSLSLHAPAALPRTPSLGHANASGSQRALTPLSVLSPATAMPRLKITESSPRTSPVPPGLQEQEEQRTTEQKTASMTAGQATMDSSMNAWHRDQQQQHQQLLAGATTNAVSPTYLPGDTPPTKAVAGDSSIITSNTDNSHALSANVSFEGPSSSASMGSSLPSSSMSMFGPPLASPLFGGMFAPLNMEPADEGDLEAEGEPGGPQALLI